MQRPNPNQVEHLLVFMLEHADFARGRIRNDCGNVTGQRLWIDLVEELNSKGPPIRSLEAWKKVNIYYIDIKYTIKYLIHILFTI